jgi:protein disulfide-isomerase
MVLGQQQGIAWQSDIAAAQQLAAQTNRLVLVHFWSTTCEPCMRLEQEVFNRPETVSALNTNFVCVKVNTNESVELAKTYNVTMLPTDVVLSADGRLIAQLRCPPTANQYIQQLSQAATGYRQLMAQGAGAASQVGQYAQQYGAQAQTSIANYGDALTGAVPPAMPAAQPGVAPPTTSAALSTPSNASSSQGAPVSAYSDDRYADYMRSRQADVSGAIGNASAQVSSAANTVSDYASRYATPPAANVAPAITASVTPQLPTAAVQTPPMTSYPPQIPVHAEQRTQPQNPPVASMQLPADSPPLALDGYCTVRLKEAKNWVPGDRRFGAVHRGRTYLFTGPEEQQKFLAAPDFYAPVISGNDPVLAMDSGQAVPGKRTHGVFYDNRIFLFADETTLQRFYQNPNRYAAEVVQAMR